jgi:hypothetical protein
MNILAECQPFTRQGLGETRLEEEISELRNFVTVFKNGRENIGTKMAGARRDLTVM